MRGLDAAFSSHALQSIADIVCTQRSSGSPVFYRVREGDETSCVAIVFKLARRNHTIAHFDPYYNDSVSVVVPFSCNCCTIQLQDCPSGWSSDDGWMEGRYIPAWVRIRNAGFPYLDTLEAVQNFRSANIVQKFNEV